MGKSFGLGQVTFSINEKTSQILNNNMSPSETTINNLINAFKHYMSTESSIHDWEFGNHLCQLTSMANPESPSLQPNQKHMILDAENRNNQFLEAKKIGLTLPPHADFDDYKNQIADLKQQRAQEYQIISNQIEAVEKQRIIDQQNEDLAKLEKWEQAKTHCIGNQPISSSAEELALLQAFDNNDFTIKLNNSEKLQLLAYLTKTMKSNKSWKPNYTGNKHVMLKKHNKTKKVMEWIDELST